MRTGTKMTIGGRGQQVKEARPQTVIPLELRLPIKPRRRFSVERTTIHVVAAITAVGAATLAGWFIAKLLGL
jgi:hypothetical protein